MFLESNLAEVRRTHPESAERIRTASGDVRVELARTGAPTLCVAGRYEASLEDPVEHAAVLARGFEARARDAGATRLVVFGMGVHTLARLDFPGDVLVIEPDPAVARATLEAVDLTGPLARIALVCGTDVQAVLDHPLFCSTERGLFVADPTARARAGAFCDRLACHFRAGGASERLDVAVIPPLYGGSLPVAQACAEALRQLGHRVRYCDVADFLPAYRAIETHTADGRLARHGAELRAGLVRLIGETLVSSFELDPPDVIFALAQAPLDTHSLDAFARRGIGRAFWFCEDFHVMRYWSELASAYDVFFHVQPETFREPLRAAGGHGVPLPMAFDPAIHRPVSLTPEERDRYGADLSFLGAGYHNRVQFLPALFPLGLKIWGTDWPLSDSYRAAMPEANERQSAEDSNLIFNATRVNVNLHSSPWCDGVNPAGDYLNPRTFELAGAGAFQLVDERSDLASAFASDEIAVFHDVESCRREAAYFLAHPDESTDIAARARARALRDHTYRERMESAVEAIRSGPVPIGRSGRRNRTAGHAADAARDSVPGLARALDRLPEETVLDGEAIGAALAAGEGALTREEKLLLFLRESRAEVRVTDTTAAA